MTVDGTTLHLLRPWCLLAMPLWWILCFYCYRRQASAQGWQRCCDPALLQYLLMDDKTQEHRPGWWWLLAIAGSLLLLALAGPAWQRLKQPVFQQQSAVVVMLDLSRSMDAQDLKPSRLARAKQKLRDVLRAHKEGQMALVVFAGDAHIVTPLTDDTATIEAQLQSLSTDIMPVQGNHPEQAIDKALALLRQAAVGHGELLLIGDDVSADAVHQAAIRVRQQGHALSLLAVGTPAGAPVPLPSGGFLHDRAGKIVVPKLDIKSFSAVAAAGGGLFRQLRLDDGDIQALQQQWQQHTTLDHHLKAQQRMHDQWREDGPWLILLLLPVVALAFRRGWLYGLWLLLATVQPPDAQAATWQDWFRNADQQGMQLMQQDRYAEAAARFKDREWKATAAYRAGHYAEAARLLQGIHTADAHYNRGNALARLGKIQAAIKAYDAALALNPHHEDARYNREQLMQRAEDGRQRTEGRERRTEGRGQKEGDGRQSAEGIGQKAEDGGQKTEDGKRGTGSTGGGRRGQEAEEMRAQARKDQQKQQMTEESGQEATDGKTKEGDKAALATARGKKAAPEQPLQGLPPVPGADAPPSKEALEAAQRYEQFIRRVPDDPGGLLRRKFLYQRQQAPQQPPADGAISW